MVEGYIVESLLATLLVLFLGVSVRQESRLGRLEGLLNGSLAKITDTLARLTEGQQHIEARLNRLTGEHVILHHLSPSGQDDPKETGHGEIRGGT